MILQHYLILSGCLFTIGAVGVLTRRNIIMILLSIEIMLNAASLSFVTFSNMTGDVSGQVATLFIIAIAASEVAVGLAIVVLLFRRFDSIDTEAISLMKG